MKKIISIIAIFLLSIGSLITIICLKFSFPFKPSFYSFASYADEKTISNINKKYTYKEYGSINEFEYAFENDKAIAGITSDYSIISLIKDQKISPIRLDIEKIANLNQPWESYFSQEVVDQMSSYNQFLSSPENLDLQNELRSKYSEYGENYIFKFSDFVIPYFINDKVLAYNTKKILDELNTNENPLGFTSYPTLEEALKKLTSKLSDIKIQWTKNERENIVNGSTINNPNNEWNTEITNNNYQELINNFSNIILEGTGASISDIKRNLFENDSDVILNNLINPSSKIDASFIYNGDALDAYFGHDNFHEIQDGDRLRIIRTKYTIRVLDCFVVSSSIDNDQKLNLLDFFNKYMFNGMFLNKEELNELTIKNNDIYELDGIMRIFNYVNYTLAAKGPYEYIYENYFKDENGIQDEIARRIYKVSTNDPDNGIYVKSIPYINKEVLSKLTISFQQKLNGF